MKSIEQLRFLNEELTKIQLIESRILLINKQIEGYEKLMESGQSLIKCVNSYNLCCSLVEQLKYHSAAAFFDPVDSLEKPEGMSCKEIKC